MEIKILDSAALPNGVTVTANADVGRGTPRTILQLANKRFGVGERITLKPASAMAAANNAQWSATGGFVGAQVTNCAGGEGKFRCPDTRTGDETYTMRLTLKRLSDSKSLAIVIFDVIRPSVSKQVWSKDIHYGNPVQPPAMPPRYWNDDPNGGYVANWYFGPSDVYFGEIEGRECGGNNVWQLTGVCKQHTKLEGKKHSDGDPENWGTHAAALLAWTNDGTLMGSDRVYTPLEVSGFSANPFTADAGDPDYGKVIGSGSLCIPDNYRLKGSTDNNGREFAQMLHQFTVTKGGKITVFKHSPGHPELGAQRSFPRDAVNQP